jgi:hypothetical protein
LINHKMHLLLGFNPPEPEPIAKDEGVKRKRTLRFTKTTKVLIGVVFIAAILVSCFSFYPQQPLGTNPDSNATPDPSDSTEPTTNPSNGGGSTQTPKETSTNKPTAKPNDARPTPDTSHKIVSNAKGNLTKADWRKIAEYAWKYFEANTNYKTGLPGSTEEFSAFTDWDLGVYLQAVMDAQRIGLIGTDGEWGSYARVERILTFLETRELNPAGYPYWFYTSEGKNYKEQSDKATTNVDIADTGRLLLALHNVKKYNPAFENRIDSFVYNIHGNRSNYKALVPAVRAEGLASDNIYAYYVFSGFASFWSDELKGVPEKILENILNAPKFSYGNITLPQSKLLSEPLFGAIFETENPPGELYRIGEMVYLAHETYYNMTGKYRAFSEGPTTGTSWAWEWTVNGDEAWVVLPEEISNMTPMIYTKTAFSFLALYNRPYAVNLCMYLEDKLSVPSSGYYSGMDEDEVSLQTTSLHTNGVIITAARYAYEHLA